MKREIVLIGSALAVYEASRFALSLGVKRQCLREARGRCTAQGRHEGILEAAHYNHVRDEDYRFYNGLPPYDSKEAARILCTRHHLLDHINGSGQNGLSKEDNDIAILSLMKRLNISSLDQLR